MAINTKTDAMMKKLCSGLMSTRNTESYPPQSPSLKITEMTFWFLTGCS